MARPMKPSATVIGSSASARGTPSRFITWPGDDRLQDERRGLRDEVDLRERRGAHVQVVAERRDHLQAGEVDEGRDDREDQHVGGDAEQVGRSED